MVNTEQSFVPVTALALAFQSSLLSGGAATVDVQQGLNIGDLAIDNKIAPSACELGRSLFFGGATKLCATLGRIHPHLRKGEIHLSTSDGLKSLIRHLLLGEPRVVPEVTAETLEGSAAVFGGPVANLHARLVFGCGGKSPLLGVVLPVTFDCVSSLDEAMQFRTEPWSVVVEGRASQRECLVITSLPMDNSEDRLTIFSGLHGAGTRAIDLIFTNEHLLEKIYLNSRKFTAWQALIEVNAKNSEYPTDLGETKLFEIGNVDFSRRSNLIRDQLFLTKPRINELIQLLPSKQVVDPSDPDTTGIRYTQKLRTRVPCAMVSGDNASFRLPSRLAAPQKNSPERESVHRSRDRAVHRPRQNEVQMSNPRRRGRPPKETSEAILTHRLQILLSAEDIERITTIMTVTGAASMGEVVREAIRRNFERTVQRRQKHQ